MTNDYEIIRGRTEMRVAHEKGRVTFVSPARGPNVYAKVQEAITQDSLIAPTMGQTASLAYTALQNKKESEFHDVISKLDNNWLWAFNGILYTPKGDGDYQNGAIIQDNPQVKNGRVSLVKSELVKKLEAGDKSVRFVNFGF
ncbi:MAG: hypothetical protein Q8L27_03175 [archaeon]|nr:hypothetical protein [archaeon]